MENTSHLKPLLESLRSTFLKQKTKPISFRRQQLKQLMRGLNELDNQFEQAIHSDLGYDSFSHFMLNSSIVKMAVQEVLDNLKEWTKQRPADTSLLIGPGNSYIQPEPLGVSLIVGAWNYPLFTILPQLAVTIAAGNCAVLKPSEMAPATSKAVHQLVHTYLDTQCYSVVQGSVPVIQALLQLKWDCIQFTGSPQKGRLIAQAAATHLTPCVLELGGKSPCIIDKDANQWSAVRRVVQSKFANSGQTCVAPDYLLVHQDIYPQVKQQLVDYIKQAFYQGETAKQEGQVLIINEFHTRRLQGLIQDSKGQILIGGHCDVKARRIAPTLLDQPSLQSSVMTEEIFGPVLPIHPFSDIQEVINNINKGEKPLALYYYGSQNKALVRDSTSSGAFVQNDSTMQVINFEMPFGGVGNSGYGCMNTKRSFDHCSHLKAVLEKGNINCFPFHCRFPPYTQSKKNLWKMLVNLIGIKRQNQTIKRSILVLLFFVTLGAALYLNKNYKFNLSINPK